MLRSILKRLQKYSPRICYILIFLLLLKFLWKNNNKRNIPPKWLKQDFNSCLPARDIAFLKTHKAASSTIQGILFRYGLRNNLTFALPQYDIYFGGAVPFNSEMVARSGPFNIFTMHTKWDHKQISSVMAEGTIFFSIVRDPISLFESFFSYFGLEKSMNLSLDQFVARTQLTSPRSRSFIGLNQMTWDFGLPLDKMDDHLAIQQLISEADQNFHLVLLAERMDESLILLRHLLCITPQDIFTLKLNARRLSIKKPLNPETRSLLKEKLAPDYQLYKHFRAKFKNLVREFGKRRMMLEISQLKKESKKFKEYCGIKRLPPEQLMGPSKTFTNMVMGYKSSKKTFSCRVVTWSENWAVEYIRHRQRTPRRSSSFFGR